MPPPYPPTPTATFTITGKDPDTFSSPNLNPPGPFVFEKFRDETIECSKHNEQIATLSGPTRRSLGTDGTAIWDLVINGYLMHNTSPNGPVVAYINDYKIYNDRGTSIPYQSILNDAPIYVSQTIINPGG